MELKGRWKEREEEGEGEVEGIWQACWDSLECHQVRDYCTPVEDLKRKQYSELILQKCRHRVDIAEVQAHPIGVSMCWCRTNP